MNDMPVAVAKYARAEVEPPSVLVESPETDSTVTICTTHGKTPAIA